MAYDSQTLETKLERAGYLLADLEEHDDAIVLYPSWTRFDHDTNEFLILDNAIWSPYDCDRVIDVSPPSERTRDR